jgi:hypothetical protein
LFLSADTSVSELVGLFSLLAGLSHCIHSNIIFPSMTRLPKPYLYFSIVKKALCAILSFQYTNKRAAQIILLHLITPEVLGEEHRA